MSDSSPSEHSPPVASTATGPGADSPEPAPSDRRLYVPDALMWTVRVLTKTDRQYCHQHAPGEDYFHLISPGEIYVEGDDENLCLNCAIRRGIITPDRLFWQRREI